jgi:hypothetical protein
MGQSGGGQGGFGAMAGPGGPSAAGATQADFSNPVKGAETFLAAAKARDARLLADSVALRAPQEADPKTRPYFVKMLDGPQSIDEELLDLMQQTFEEMSIIGTNRVNSTARLGVIVQRQMEDGDIVRRTITMRREKAGWKVADVSGPFIIDAPAQLRDRNAGQQGGSGGYGSGSGSGSSYPR